MAREEIAPDGRKVKIHTATCECGMTFKIRTYEGAMSGYAECIYCGLRYRYEPYNDNHVELFPA